MGFVMSKRVFDVEDILVTTCQVVGTLIPPLLRLGWIDQIECVVLGAVIGIVVAIRSMRSNRS